MAVTRDNRPKQGQARPLPDRYFSPEKNLNFVQQLVRAFARNALYSCPRESDLAGRPLGETRPVDRAGREACVLVSD